MRGSVQSRTPNTMTSRPAERAASANRSGSSPLPARRPIGPASRQAEHNPTIADLFAVHERPGLANADAGLELHELGLDPQLVARHNRLAETRLLDGDEIGELAVVLGLSKHDDPPQLRHGLDDQDT